MAGKGIPITKDTPKVSPLPASCSSKRGRRGAQQNASQNTEISPGVGRTAETFSFSLLAHPQSAAQQLSRGSVSRPLVGGRIWKERRLGARGRKELSQALHSSWQRRNVAFCALSTARPWQQEHLSSESLCGGPCPRVPPSKS